MSRRWLSLATAVVTVVGGQVLLAPASGSATAADRGVTRVRPPSVSDPSTSDPSIRTPAGRPIARPADIARTASPAATARGYLNRYGAKFHLSDPARQTRVARVSTSGLGHIVRAQQLAQGLPVIGGELVVTTDAANNLVSITGETAATAPRSYTPALPAAVAAERALDRVARAEGVPVSSLRASAPELSVYDASLLGPGSAVARLVWRTEVGNGLDVRHYTLVDAVRGAVVLDFSMLSAVNGGKELHVCDRADVASESDECVGNGDRSLVAGADSGALPPGAPGAADVNAAFDNSGDFSDFLFDRTGRDSLDNAGLALRSTVRYCPSGGCPYENAYWNGNTKQMVYGPGFPLADDVVGHELTHGVTEFTSGLFYYYQSGAINESISDVFGELFDQRPEAGPEELDDKWLLGEDLPVGAGEEPGSRAGRDMADPPAFDQPDKMTSSLYAAVDPSDDSGGVHTNSGVGNKAAFLMTDGGDHNGVTVAGIGPDKALQVWHAAAQLLTPGSDYADLAVALIQGCNGVVGGASGLTPGDCTQVANATAAVEMSEDPPNAPATPAPVCPAGTTKTSVWRDGFEGASADSSQLSWAVEPRAGLPSWYIADYYAAEGRQSVNAADPDELSWSGVYPVTAPGGGSPRRFTIPSDGRYTFLRFDHAYDFEADSDGNYDGGKVQYFTDGLAANPREAGSLIDSASHPYNGSVSTDWGNPIAGQMAFTGYSSGYLTTRVNLSSLAGTSVTPLFAAAFDPSAGIRFPGWFLDNVEIYTCAFGGTAAAISQSKTGITAGASATIAGRLVKLGTSTPVGSRSVRLEQRKKGTSTWRLLTSRTSSSTGAVSVTVKPTANTEYRWRFLGQSGWVASTSATRSVAVRPAITRTVNDRTIRLGTSFRVSGKVFPRMDRQAVRLQRYYRGGWHTVKRTTLTRYDATRSRYAMTYRPPVRGTLRFRVYKPADAYHPANAATFTVRVR